jgi:hypothetical protein
MPSKNEPLIANESLIRSIIVPYTSKTLSRKAATELARRVSVAFRSRLRAMTTFGPEEVGRIPRHAGQQESTARTFCDPPAPHAFLRTRSPMLGIAMKPRKSTCSRTRARASATR